MRRIVAVAVVCSMAVVVAAAQQTAQFMIPIMDDKGAPLKIAPEDLTVHENGSLARVVSITPVESQVKLVLAIENSRGMGEHLVALRNGLRDFINAVPDGVEITLLTTAPQPRTFVKATTDKKQLLTNIERFSPDSSASQSSEAVIEQLERWAKTGTRDFTPVMVVMSSTFSADNFPARAAAEILKKLPEINPTIHALVFKAPLSVSFSAGDVQAEFLQEITGRTRGRYEQMSSPQALVTLLGEYGKEVGKAAAGSRFKVTIERPAGATGPLGNLSLSPPNGVILGRLTKVP